MVYGIYREEEVRVLSHGEIVSVMTVKRSELFIVGIS